MSQNESSIGGLLTKIIIVIALIIVGWNLYTGATVQEIGIPGIFTIKFGAGPKESKTPSTSTPTASLSTENWAGNWKCTARDHEMDLTISGQGSSSTLKGYYPVAYGNRPANEDYIIKNITSQDVSGDYVYYDTNPNVGCRGKPGVFCGNWSIVFANNELALTRTDLTTSWRGEYKCERK